MGSRESRSKVNPDLKKKGEGRLEWKRPAEKEEGDSLGEG